MEFGPSKSIVPSAGNKVSHEHVKRLYISTPDSLENWRFLNDYRYPNTSLNNQLDLFYEKCCSNADCRECIGFFHTKLSIRQEHEIFCERFIPVENHRLSKIEQKNKQEFRGKMNKRKSKSSKEKFYQDSKPEYDRRQNEIDKRREIYTKIPEFLEYDLFHGYRHTFEFREELFHFKLHELWQLEHLRYWSEEERLWPSSSTFEERISEHNIIEDITNRIAESSERDNSR